jgi:hypothetical protein
MDAHGSSQLQREFSISIRVLHDYFENFGQMLLFAEVLTIEVTWQTFDLFFPFLPDSKRPK